MKKNNIQMVDLKAQYLSIKAQIDGAIEKVINQTQFIGGKFVQDFESNLSNYLSVKHTIGCANGTDALQIALMAIDAQPGDEIIIPAFTYVATAEVIALLGLIPIMIDIDPISFNIDCNSIENHITEKTKAIIPVHLFGQPADMERIMDIAQRHNLYVIEDNAQSLGARCEYKSGENKQAGTIGHIGTTSFYPAKILGAYGDGGAIFTNDDDLAQKIRMIANHGQSERYYHDTIGCNSRLDSIQAAILNVKLKHLDKYIVNRQEVADIYNKGLVGINGIDLPQVINGFTHVFHQYTLRVKNGKRDELKIYLEEKGIPTMIYYPLPLYNQKAYSQYSSSGFQLLNTEQASIEVLSLPICPDLTLENQEYIINSIKTFFE